MVLKQQWEQWQRSQIQLCANNIDLLKLPHKKDSENDNEDNNNNNNSNKEDNNNEDN